MASVFRRKGSGPWLVQYFDHHARRLVDDARDPERSAADAKPVTNLDVQALRDFAADGNLGAGGAFAFCGPYNLAGERPGGIDA